MPIYEYRNPATGETIEMIKPAYQRDILPAPGWERVVSTPAPPELRRKYGISKRTHSRWLSRERGAPYPSQRKTTQPETTQGQP